MNMSKIKTTEELKTMMAVQCLKTRELNNNYEGHLYYIDRQTIWMDGEDVWGECYDESGKYCGQVNLLRFMTVTNNL